MHRHNIVLPTASLVREAQWGHFRCETIPWKSPFHIWAHKSAGTHSSDCVWIVLSLFRRPDTVKQKNAFPPNFIHSLDSTHMMLTALHCYRYLCCKWVFSLVLQSGLNLPPLLPSFNSSFIHSAGLTFVSVHDCYWTHALTVDTMNKVSFPSLALIYSPSMSLPDSA